MLRGGVEAAAEAVVEVVCHEVAAVDACLDDAGVGAGEDEFAHPIASMIGERSFHGSTEAISRCCVALPPWISHEVRV